MKTLNLENMEKCGINMTQNAPTNRLTPNNIPGVLVGIAVLTVCLQSLCTVKWSRSFFSLPSLQVRCFARISDLWQGRKPDIEGWKKSLLPVMAHQVFGYFKYCTLVRL